MECAFLKLVQAPDEDPQSPAVEAGLLEAAIRLRSVGLQFRNRIIEIEGARLPSFPEAEFTFQTIKVLAPTVATISSVTNAWTHTLPGRKVCIGREGNFAEFDNATDEKLIEDTIRDVMNGRNAVP